MYGVVHVTQCQSQVDANYLSSIYHVLAVLDQADKHRVEQHHALIVLILVNHKNCCSNNLDMQ